MTDDRIIEVWLGFGKLINVGTVAAAQADAMKLALTNTMRQFGRQDGSGDGSDLYDDMIRVVVPLENRLQPTVSSMQRLPALVKASVDAYIRVLGDEYGLPANAQTASILDALKADMIGEGEAIYPSGALFNYFSATYGYSGFPTSSTPTIPDEWITSTLTLRPLPPSPPTFTDDEIEAAESGILLNWSDTDMGDSNVDRFRVKRAPEGGSYAVIFTTADATDLDYLDTGTVENQRYYYVIEAHNAGGGWSAPSVERSTISQGPN